MQIIGNNSAPVKDPEDGPAIELRGFSYDEQGRIVPALLKALAVCDCWVHEKRVLSATRTALRFDVHLRSAFELYSQLIGAGVEMTRESHAKLTGLCTVRRHNLREAKCRRLLAVRLELSFLEECNLELGMMSIGLA